MAPTMGLGSMSTAAGNAVRQVGQNRPAAQNKPFVLRFDGELRTNDFANNGPGFWQRLRNELQDPLATSPLRLPDNGPVGDTAASLERLRQSMERLQKPPMRPPGGMP